MAKHSSQAESLSTPKWETLEAWTRAKIREGVQALLEEEVTELLSRVKSARRAAVDAPAGYRSGYGKSGRMALTSGTITVRRPRVRGLEERFEWRTPALKPRLGAVCGEPCEIKGAPNDEFFRGVEAVRAIDRTGGLRGHSAPRPRRDRS